MTRPATCAVLAVALAGCRAPTVAFAPARWPAAASFAPVPGVVVDPAAGLAFLADGAGGTDTVELDDGAVRWHTDAIATPLVAAGGALFGLAEDLAGPERPPGPDAFRLVRVDAGGAVAFTSEPVELPGDLVVGVAPQELQITARRDGDAIAVAVRGFEDPPGRFDPSGGDPDLPDEVDVVVVNDVLAFDAVTGALRDGRLRARRARSIEERMRLGRDPRWRPGRARLRSAPYVADPGVPWRLGATTTAPILAGAHLVTFAHAGEPEPTSTCDVVDVSLVLHDADGARSSGAVELGRACARAMVVDPGLLVLAEPPGDGPGAIAVVALPSGAPVARIAIDPGAVIDVASLGDDVIVIHEVDPTDRPSGPRWQLAVHDRATGARRWARPVVPKRTSSEYDSA